jgi:hypothetical protein
VPTVVTVILAGFICRSGTAAVAGFLIKAEHFCSIGTKSEFFSVVLWAVSVTA